MPTTKNPEPEDTNAQDASAPEAAATPIAAPETAATPIAAPETVPTAPTVPLAAEHSATSLPPHPGVRPVDPVAASTSSEKQRKGLRIGGIIAAGALTVGLVFGGGVALGLAIPEGHGETRAQIDRGGNGGPGHSFGERNREGGRDGRGGFGRP